MKNLWLGLGILTCAIMITTAAADAPLRKAWEVKPENAQAESKILGRNVRLDFQALPRDEGDNGIYLITATSDYVTSIQLEGDDNDITFKVSGQVQILDDGKIYVGFEAYTQLTGDEGKAEFYTKSGVILESGQALGVSRIGEKTLMITATYVE